MVLGHGCFVAIVLKYVCRRFDAAVFINCMFMNCVLPTVWCRGFYQLHVYELCIADGLMPRFLYIVLLTYPCVQCMLFVNYYRLVFFFSLSLLPCLWWCSSTLSVALVIGSLLGHLCIFCWVRRFFFYFPRSSHLFWCNLPRRTSGAGFGTHWPRLSVWRFLVAVLATQIWVF